MSMVSYANCPKGYRDSLCDCQCVNRSDHAVTTIHEIRTTFTPKVNVGLSSMVCEIGESSII